MWGFCSRGFGASCITVFKNNEGAKNPAKNHVCTSNSKHMDVQHHFLRELVVKGGFVITHVESDYQHAEILTKPLDYTVLLYHRDCFMNI